MAFSGAPSNPLPPALTASQFIAWPFLEGRGYPGGESCEGCSWTDGGGAVLKEENPRREPSQQEWDRAVFYAQTWVIPLLQAEPGELTRLVQEMARQSYDIPHSRRSTVSETTLWRMLRHYQESGMDGLCRKPRNDAGRFRALPTHILDRAIQIRRDLPSRSLFRILNTLKKEFPLEMKLVKASTLSRALTAAGCPRVRPKRRQKPVPRKERYIRMRWKRPLQLVQSDVCGQTLWVTEEGEVRKASLMAVLDHCSKLCLHGEWFLAANLPALEKCVTIALLAFGNPERLHVDHGAIYESYLLRNICSELGIDLKFTRRGYAPGKGGIERFWLTVEQDFILEVGDSRRLSLADLNIKYQAWQHEYNHRPHSTTKEPPVECFQRLAKEVSFPDPVRLYRAGLLREQRVVDKRYCTVRVRCVNFAVHPSLRGKTVQVRFDAFNLAEILVYDQTGGRFLQKATPESPDREPAPFLPEEPAHRTPSIDVLAGLEEDHARHLESRRGQPAAALPSAVKGRRFSSFCQQIGKLLKRESTLSSFELTLMREYWEGYGPFSASLVRGVLAPMVLRAGDTLHLDEYLKALVEAKLEQKVEEDAP